ncbi:MAG: hypothetical protein ACXITV_04910 [Luteibaculaceae bacterium]
MGLSKGKTNNPNGRPKGAVNKTSLAAKEFIKQLFESNLNTIEADLLQLEPKDRLKVFIDLLPYLVPKQATEINGKFNFVEQPLFILPNESA